jgi:heparinase II/III-like protein
MTLLLSGDALLGRRDIAAGSLAPLAASLARDLEPLLQRPLFIPDEKAQLSRAGGRCERDGSLLEFEPFSPNQHRCPLCGTVYSGETHYRFWIYWYQLWLIERAAHAALLSALGAGPSLALMARRILLGYAERYARYPNVDNVLGPTRLFFSTYLEAIWLLHVCIATDLLEQGGDSEIGAIVRERIVEPSSAIIAEYDEGASNRQVWNVAALFAAYRSLGREDDARRLVTSASGLVFHLREGLLEDGTWYEGENYHQFAHRGLWYGVTMAEHAGIELPPELVRRFEEGFATPFLTALPDLTLPSRRDSQYRISLRQWRFAELCELGLARRDDPRLRGALSRLYSDEVPRGPAGRDRSSAEAERNSAPSSLSREDLGWRSLLFARRELPALEPYTPRSALLSGQGIGVLRREQGSVYAALDYGHSGGGHGHPDRLNVLLSDGDVRWLDDMGTGSYVDPSLHWYRSSLAHNAPLVDGRSQLRVHGSLIAFEEQSAAGWCAAKAAGIAPGVTANRAIVAMPEYLLDVLIWDADRDVNLDLPIHIDAAPSALRLSSSALDGSDALEDGFRFVRAAATAVVKGGEVVAISARREPRTLHAWCVSDSDAEWWYAAGPGAPPPAPPRPEQPFSLVRQRGRGGRLRCVYAWSDSVQRVEVDGDTTTVHMNDGTRHLHAPNDEGWRVDVFRRDLRESIHLGGLVRQQEKPYRLRHPTPVHAMPTERVLATNRPLRFALGEAHYRRSEQSWRDAGSPAAEITLTYRADVLEIRIDVPRSALTFSPPNADNPWDNENADVNGDGVQLYVETKQGRSAWMLVPNMGDSTVRMRQIDGWPDERTISAFWSRQEDGYSVVARVSLEAIGPDGSSVGVDVIVNEKPAGRERRRGQLLLSGAQGEFVYLRGDRQESHRLLHFRLKHG